MLEKRNLESLRQGVESQAYGKDHQFIILEI